ncbi:uncharacterized protein LOC114527883 [Dendronephthya gigantea]|uniref:uncharacterized protein LOC114527883 n=1 Tax=Dendronephthya gigantea TaxID=151771 RepID=UPI0010691A52|nr:uncharacterized protein LOC114527883 [Dendronephthya gigantea]
MIFQIYVRTILTVFVTLSCKPSYSLATVIEGDNITEYWEWLPDNPVDIEEHDSENKTSLWSKVSQAKSRVRPKATKDVNWCMHVGVPFENMNFSRFQLTNKCCKEHFLSALVEINSLRLYKCTDETKFYNCLKEVKTTMSRSMGDYYFNKMATACYNIEAHDYCFRTVCGSVILKISADTIPAF